jgi:hypothetical protein
MFRRKPSLNEERHGREEKEEGSEAEEERGT